MDKYNITDMEVVDLETTGFSPFIPKKYPKNTKNSINKPLGAEIIEIGVTDLSHLKLGKNYSRLIKPKKGVPERITKLTSISNDMLIHEKSLEDVLPSFRKFIGNKVFVGHNAKFDLRFLNYYLELMNLPPIENYICTMELLKTIGSYKGKDYKLGTAVDYYGIKLLNAHRAYADTYATACLLLKIIPFIGGIENLKVEHI